MKDSVKKIKLIEYSTNQRSPLKTKLKIYPKKNSI